MERDFECQARVTFQGEPLHMNKIIARLDLEEIMPPRGPVLDPSDMFRMRQAEERRQRFVDMIASEFAHSLTEALFKLASR